MGGLCTCLQVTFQAKNLIEARHLYDQLTPIAPLMLALTASSPIWRGFLCDTDCRWRALSESADDRTPEESGTVNVLMRTRRSQPSSTRKKCAILRKTRFDTVDCYLSENLSSEYNDLDVVKHETCYEYLVQNGVDNLMAQHISHLFIREPLIISEEDLDDTYGYVCLPVLFEIQILDF
jgi:glutamate--cysteine ligase catalytic subunit